ncbi:hypothetical protein OpiT1DRAFT_00017 [Opitutaceae bacterium TAV1]|nr:hypothetical protein OpiT1DRAFT_00017 [Opitutaceae bacterium TAV1]
MKNVSDKITRFWSETVAGVTFEDDGPVSSGFVRYICSLGVEALSGELSDRDAIDALIRSIDEELVRLRSIALVEFHDEMAADLCRLAPGEDRTDRITEWVERYMATPELHGKITQG